MMELNFSRDSIMQKLHEGETTVTFTKVDGSERVMRCTLNEAMLPPAEPTESTAERKVNPNVVAVWDLDKEGWRSFKVDSVKSLV